MFTFQVTQKTKDWFSSNNRVTLWESCTDGRYLDPWPAEHNTNKEPKEGKVLRVFSSGRWVPRNQG
jgi:hypothetical protein